MEVFYDIKREISFKSGIRVHWFEYFRDGIVKDGGFGTIVDLEQLKEKYTWDQEICILAILCDDGIMRSLPHSDVDLVEDWNDD